jgi:hypothetical protein
MELTGSVCHAACYGPTDPPAASAPHSTSGEAGWSWGCVSAIDSRGRTIWIADAHRDDGKRFVVPADEKLTAFIELSHPHHSFLSCQAGEIFSRFRETKI